MIALCVKYIVTNAKSGIRSSQNERQKYYRRFSWRRVPDHHPVSHILEVKP